MNAGTRAVVGARCRMGERLTFRTMSVVLATLAGAVAGGLGGFVTAVYTSRAESIRARMQSDEDTRRAIQVAEMETDRAIRAAAEESEREIRNLRTEFAARIAEARTSSPSLAQSLAQQSAIGLLTVDGEPSGKMKIFIAPRCRITAGRGAENDIDVSDPMFSRRHMAFVADDNTVYVEPLNASHPIFLRIHGASIESIVSAPEALNNNDVVRVGQLSFKYTKLLG